MIIRGGENIYPKEIEEFIYHACRRFSDVQVIGVPDKQLRRGDHGVHHPERRARTMTEEEMQGRMSLTHMAKHKVPRYVDVRERASR